MKQRVLAFARPARIDGSVALLTEYPDGTLSAYKDEAALIRHLRTQGHTGVYATHPKQTFCMCRTYHGRITVYGDA